jgi:CheY-like chemotaxis protein
LQSRDLTELVKKYKSDNETFHDLIQARVREILIVTTIYDAFILEQEDRLTEQIFGEYYSLNLSTAPRVTSASSGEEALELLDERRFDLVILTIRINDMTPFDLSSRIREKNKSIPVFLLLYDNAHLQLLRERKEHVENIDKVFVWNRDSKIFLAMIKYVEDKVNADNDTKIGLVRVILLVENSVRYYSRYLPTLYTEIIKQTQRLIKDEHLDAMKKVLRMSVRPKVLMAVNYEEAIDIFTKYKDYLLCVISDVRFPREGVIDEHAGVNLIQYVKKELEDLPVLLQSSDPENEKLARTYNASFINKNSETLASDLTDFIFHNLGFGDFVWRDTAGKEIARSKGLYQFRKQLRKVPEDTIVYHAMRNHFSAWLMARGEIRIAKKLQPIKVTDFRNPHELRDYLTDIFENVDVQSIKGKVVEFDESVIAKENYVVRLCGGSLGGKGRGIAFINAMIQNMEVSSVFKNVDVKIPRTAIIGTEEYDSFIEKNKLDFAFEEDVKFSKLKERFLKGQLSKQLVRKLKTYIKHVTSPVAVRSSGLFEDSISESFSGVYETFLLPNNHSSLEERLRQLQNAVKLVYASVFSDQARSYFDAVNYKIDEEKMAVVIQEVVGNKFDELYYPDFSGVAQSYNYYPISYMKPADGIAVIGVGLGKYVIDGEKAYRFSPKHPKLAIITPDALLKNSQGFFYGVDMSRNDYDLSSGEDATLRKAKIERAEKDGRLEQLASVWDSQNARLKPGIEQPGPRIIDFGYILKYDSFPLSQILNTVLDIVKNSMGTPAEIEFAVDLTEDGDRRPSFYILQLKPLIRDVHEYNINTTELDHKKLFLYTEKGMGNGKIEDIYDIVFCDPDKFDKSKTLQMTSELERLNNIMKKENRKYILIGPGRWGTRDRWLGIPVVWTQISNAKIIVEAGLKDFYVDASLGSHFFHNITSMNIGYFNVPFGSANGFIDWDWLKSHRHKNTTHHFVHLRFNKPLLVLMDGRKSISLIYKDKEAFS